MRSRCEQPLVLALLPVDPSEIDATYRLLIRGEPGVDGGAELGLAAQACGEGELVELDREALTKPAKRAQLVELGETVETIAGSRALRRDEPVLLEVPEHPCRPARLGRGVSDRQLLHAANLTTCVARLRSLRRRTSPRARTGPSAARCPRSPGWRPRGSSCPRVR